MSKKKVLHLAKWYPNKEEPLLGIFIQKHIQSVQQYYDNKVISVYQTDTIKSNIHRIVNHYNNTEEVIFYHKKGLLNKIRVLYRVWEETNRFQPHLIHAHVMGWTCSLAFFFSRTNQVPFLISEHWSGYRKKGYAQLNFASKILRKISARKAEQICVVSNFLKEDMLKCCVKGNYTTLGNVVDGKALNIEKNKTFSFVFAGDLVQETKNVKGILEAFYEVIKHHKNIKLEIIGDGKDLKNYKALSNKLKLNNHISFHGNRNNDYVFKTLSQSHVLILNSYFETFSIICAEALLCGIPVISTKCGGPESFLNDETGILIDCDSNNQLIKAMKDMINNYDQYETEKLKSMAHQFSMDSIGEKINQQYLRALN
jgi:glycosyltransferase involved in cell wall biosynthesis